MIFTRMNNHDPYESFINHTKPYTTFFIENVANDDACFYRSIANQLFYQSRYEKANIILSKNNILNTKSFDSVSTNKLWGYDGKEQTKMAKILQQTARRFIYKNHTTRIHELGITVSNLVTTTHTLQSMKFYYPGWKLIDIYNEVYKTFAGTKVFLKYTTSQKPLLERWGGAPEQWALSHYLKIPIIVYHLQKYNKKNNKIQQGRYRNNKAYKNTRFKVYQIFGQEYFKTTIPLTILFMKTQKGNHYLSLYENHE